MASGRADGSIIINTKILESGFNKGLSSMKNKLSGFGRAVEGSMGSMDSSLGRTAEKIQNIGKLIAGAFAIGKLIQFGKEAVQLGSDLAEMENVTDTVFPSMTKEIKEWSDAALDNYGLTRTMAKNYVGTFGAMAKAFGFSERKAYDMSTQLAGLSGDVASFYNLSQDEAFTKLKSIFTGETESLKSLGVVMTQTALDQYALANGFGKTVANMTEAEKVELRMAFVTDKLNAASGDFVKTQDSWANQTKRLSANFQELKTTIGQGLINLFTPVIKGINTLLSYLHTAAEAFNTFTATLMGKKKSSSGGSVAASAAASEAMSGVADTASGVADSTYDAADATDDYTASQKAAQKAANSYLSTLDEVNRYTTQQAADTGSASSPKSGSGKSAPASSGAAGIPAQLEQVYDDSAFAVEDIEEEFSEFAQKLRDAFLAGDWEGLGRIIGEKINEIMGIIKEKISWDNVGPAITKFVDAFTRTFNSLVKTIDWHLIGETIGTGINTIIYTLTLLITGIDWGLLGRSFAAGVNGLAETVDWEALGNLLAERFLISWRLFAGFVSEVNWGSIGNRIGNGLRAALKKLNKNADLIYGAMSDFGTGLAEFLNNLITPELFEEVGTAIANSLNSQLVFLNNFGETFDFEEFGSSLASGIKKIFHEFDWQMLGRTITVWAKRLLASAKFFLSERPWETLFDGVKVLIENIDFKGIGTGIIEAIWTGISGEEMDQDTKENVLSSFSELESTLGTIANYTFGGITDLYNNVLVPLGKWLLGEGLPELARIIANTLAKIDWESLKGGFGKLETALEPFAETIGGGLITFLEGVGDLLGLGLSFTTTVFGKALGILATALSNIPSSGLLEPLGGAIGGIVTAIIAFKGYETVKDVISGITGVLPGFFGVLTGNPVFAAAAGAFALGGAVYTLFKQLTTNELTSKVNDVNTALSGITETLKGSELSETSNYQYISGILDDFNAINEKLLGGEDLTSEERRQFQTYLGILSNYAPKITEKIDSVTGAYTGTKDELQNLINKQYEEAMSSVYANAIAEYGKAYSDAEANIRAAAEGISAYLVETGASATEYDKVMQLITAGSAEARQDLVDGWVDAGEDVSQIMLLFDSNEVVKYFNQIDVSSQQMQTASDNIGKTTEKQQEFMDMIRGGSTDIPDIVDFIFNSFTSGADAAAASAEIIEDSLIKAGGGFDIVGKASEDAAEYVDMSMEQMAATFADTYTDSEDFVAGFDAVIMNGLPASVKNATDEVKGIFEAHKGDGEAYGTETGDGAARGINGRKESVKAAIRNVAGSVTKTYGDEMGLANGSSSVMEGAGKDTVKGIETGTSDRKSQLLSIFEELPTNMMDMMGDLMTEFRFPGRIIISGIRYGINDNKQALFDHLAGLVPKMAEQLSGLNATMWTIGHNAMQYLANGIRSVHIPTPQFNVGTQWANGAGVAFPIPSVSVTWMASGAVIPRNSAKFLAGLGDNNHETEVVSPLSTMKQAVSEVLLEMGITGNSGANRGPIKVQVNRRTIFEETLAEAREQMDRTSVNPFDLGLN